MPFISSASNLRNLGQTHGTHALQKMNDFIQEQSMLDGYNENKIPINPEKIAFIMTHDDIIDTFIKKTAADLKANIARLKLGGEEESVSDSSGLKPS